MQNVSVQLTVVFVSCSLFALGWVFRITIKALRDDMSTNNQKMLRQIENFENDLSTLRADHEHHKTEGRIQMNCIQSELKNNSLRFDKIDQKNDELLAAQSESTKDIALISQSVQTLQTILTKKNPD